MLHATFNLKLFKCFHILIFQYKTETYSLRLLLKSETWQHLDNTFSKSYIPEQTSIKRELDIQNNVPSTDEKSLSDWSSSANLLSKVCLSLSLPVCCVCLGTTEQGGQENKTTAKPYVPIITDRRCQEALILVNQQYYGIVSIMIEYILKYHHTVCDLVTGKFSTPFLQELF